MHLWWDKYMLSSKFIAIHKLIWNMQILDWRYPFHVYLHRILIFYSRENVRAIEKSSLWSISSSNNQNSCGCRVKVISYRHMEHLGWNEFQRDSGPSSSFFPIKKRRVWEMRWFAQNHTPICGTKTSVTSPQVEGNWQPTGEFTAYCESTEFIFLEFLIYPSKVIVIDIKFCILHLRK